MKLILHGTQAYIYHQELISLISDLRGGNDRFLDQYLKSPTGITFANLTPEQIRNFLKSLEACGFTVGLTENRNEIKARIHLPRAAEVSALRDQIQKMNARLDALECSEQSSTEPALEQNPAFQKLAQMAGNPAAEQSASSTKSHPESGTTESQIGKFWLSLIGISALVIGIALFINHTFRFLGPWGKIGTGIVAALGFIGAGNWLARKPQYDKWGLSILGGGWGIAFFTIYAAYAIPMTQVIHRPVVGLLGLLLVSAGSIIQSIRYRSAALIFGSYFLSFVAINLTDTSYLGLAASTLLGGSILIIASRLGLSQLILLGLGGVYLTHFLWLQPHIFFLGQSEVPSEGFIEALILPWTDSSWRLYPLIERSQSLLHQAFLWGYWMLFSLAGFLKLPNRNSQQKLIFSLSLMNNLIFAAAYMHHLHVYQPEYKSYFALLAGLLMLSMAWVQSRRNFSSVADAHLGVGTIVLALAIPLTFDGQWVTYGWSGATLLLARFGARSSRRILPVLSALLGSAVMLRLMGVDFAQREIWWETFIPLRSSLPIFLAAAAAQFLAAYCFWRTPTENPSKLRRWMQNSFVMAGHLALSWGVLIGGARTAASVVWLAQACWLIYFAVKTNRISLKIFAGLFIFFAFWRMAAIDAALSLSLYWVRPESAVRYTAVFLSLIWAGILAHYLDRLGSSRYINCMRATLIIGGACLLAALTFDAEAASWASLAWTALALWHVATGFHLKEKILRWTGLGLFALVTLRVVAHDIMTLDPLYRIVSLIGMGLLFMSAGWIYSHFSRQVKE